MNDGFADRPLRPLGHPHNILVAGVGLEPTSAAYETAMETISNHPAINSTSGRIRTHDLLVRSETL